MLLTAQGRPFKGTPQSFADLSAFCSPAPFGASGIFLGINPMSHNLVWLDLPDLQMKGVINGRQCQVIAPRRHGKSLLFKSIGFRSIGMQAGEDIEGLIKRTRLEANDRKIEGEDKGEWMSFGRTVGAEFIVVSEEPNLDLFHPDMMMNEAQKHDLAIKMCEFASERTLDPDEKWVLLVALRKMYAEYPGMAGSDTIKFVVRTLTPKDRDDYFRNSDAEIMENHAEALDYDPKLREKFEVASRKWFTPMDAMEKREREEAIAEFLDAARRLTTLLGNAEEGEFGKVIGGKNSPLKFLRENRRKVIVWTGTTRKTQGILELAFQILHENAMAHPELDVIPDIRFSDEDRSAESEILLRTQLERTEKSRGLPTDEWRSVQYEKGVEMTIGDEGSAVRGLAKLIDLGTSVRFLGKQPASRKYLDELAETYSIPSHIVELSPNLEMGDWIMWVNGARESQIVRHIVTPSELYLGRSDSATEGRLRRRDVIEEYGYEPKIMSEAFIRRLLQRGQSINFNPQN